MSRNQIKKETHFIANFLAKFENSYELLNYKTQIELHKEIQSIFDIGYNSFRQLRDEYDGFYSNKRKGHINPERRKSRIRYKEEFENISKDDYIKQVKLLLNPNINEFSFNDEINSKNKDYYEGHHSQVFVNKYERNSNARKECLNYYNNTCYTCGYKAFDKYGKDIFILEVHHEKPISEIGEKYKVDPINDLKPLCPNCHRAIHSKKIPYTIEELKNIIKSSC